MSTVDFAELVRAVAMVKIKYASFDEPEAEDGLRDTR